MKIVSETNPSDKEAAFFEQALLDYNRSKVGHYAYEDLLFKAIDDVGDIIAGIQCQIGGGWLYIANLWVVEHHRGSGLGKQLVNLAEEKAIQKKCLGAYLYTYSFQSPQFYEKLGYRIFGELEPFCGEHTKYFLKKRF